MMKALIITLMSPIMAVFTLGSVQTIEWCLDRNTPIPWQAYLLLVVVAFWCVAAIKVSAEDWKKVNRLFGKLTGEEK